MADALSESIRDGTFPESNELLSQDVTVSGTAALLQGLAESKSQLTREIKEVSQSSAGDVDEWIAQAKRLQEDIARCKVEARNIVEEHERVEVLRNSVKDKNNKVQLLKAEIAFTEALQKEIQSTSKIRQLLREAEDDLLKDSPILAACKLIPLRSSIDSIPGGRARSLLLQLHDELRGRSQKQLEQVLEARLQVTKSETGVSLIVHDEIGLQQSSTDNALVTSTDSVLLTLSELQSKSSAIRLILRTTESFIATAFSPKLPPYATLAKVDGDTLTITKRESAKDIHKALTILGTLLQFLHDKIPSRIREDVIHELVPNTITNFVTTWLNHALPYHLQDLQQLERLQKEVTDLAMKLHEYSWPGVDVLNGWVEQIPQSWLAKRKVASLDSVRKAFTMVQGSLRPTERVERQILAVDKSDNNVEPEDDDWNAAWDDEPAKPGKAETGVTDEEDDVSGWDFDTEEQEQSDDVEKKQSTQDRKDEDDMGDAWGWGDDENIQEEFQEPKSSPQPKARPTNGNADTAAKPQEMVLTEIYHITDIPDYILEIIGKDIADSHELQDTALKYFKTSSPVKGLAGLPNLTLALFRATAPTYYAIPSKGHSLSNINLYNDTLYLLQKLNESPDASLLESSIKSLTKFARQTYSTELDMQRTILTDLLDGAQGFERCTTFPNSQACVDAVSSTVDRLRQLHKDWSSILGESHLLQSLGSLMTTIFGKVIKDIEDLEDISEAESKQLGTYCQQILSLEDLFASRLPDLTHGQTGAQQGESAPSSQIVLYVPNYLRFQYLQQILDSSLADIKFLWAEGELSLEFSVDEVVDLIKALFAESQHRRSAIRDIKGSVGAI